MSFLRSSEAVPRRLWNTRLDCEPTRKPAGLGSCTIVQAGFVIVLAVTMAACKSAQTRAPVTESAPGATSVASELSPPSSVEAGGGPTQDGLPLAARVNGQPIFMELYEKQVAQTEQALFEQGLILEGAEGEAQLAQIRRNVLNGLIEQVIIEQAAAAAGVSVTDEELEATVQASIVQGQGQESFDQWLAENNLTLEEFQEIQRSQLLANKMIEQVTALVPTTAEQVHARHILTSDSAKAQALVEELKGGANFAALAQQASEDISTAANGGDLGWFPREVPLMPPAVADEAFSLQPGEMSDIIESEQGYHIIKVEAREENRPLTPEMVVFLQQKTFEKWLGEQRSDAVIEQYVDM